MDIFKLFRRQEKEIGNIPFAVSSPLNSKSKWQWNSSAEQLEAFKSIVYGCINVRAKAVSGVAQKNGFRIYKRIDNDEFIDIPFNHPIQVLLNKPNPYLTKFQFWYLTSVYLDLFGNSYWLLQRDKKQNIKSLWILPPQKVTIVADDKGERIIKGYNFKDGTNTKFYPDTEVIHIKYPNPKDPYMYGCGIVEKLSDEIDIDNFITDFQRRFFENDATPASVISFPQVLSEQVRKAFQDSWLQRFTRKAGQIAVLEGGAEVKVLGHDKEMSYLESYKENRKKIQAVFGVPDSKLGYSETITARATLETIEYNFYKETIEPILVLIDEQLTLDLCGLYDPQLFVTHESVIPKDRLTQLQIDQTELAMGKVSINEVRERDGYEAIKGGEEPLVNLGLVKLSNAGNIASPNANLSELNYKQKEIEKDIRTEQWKQWEERRFKLEKKIEKKISPILKKLYISIIEDELSKTKSELTDEVSNNLMLNLSELFEGGMKQEFERFVRENNLDLKFNPLSSSVKNNIKKLINKSKSIPETIKARAIKIMTEGFESNLTNSQIKVNLYSGLLDDFMPSQIRTIAQTTSTYANNAGIKEASDESGVFKTKGWLSVRDDKVRDSHLDLDGVEINSNKKFTLLDGDQLDFPGDISGRPENTINCRCTLYYV